MPRVAQQAERAHLVEDVANDEQIGLDVMQPRYRFVPALRTDDLGVGGESLPQLPAHRGRGCDQDTGPARAHQSRSEERRVGKECISRWAGDELKKINERARYP